MRSERKLENMALNNVILMGRLCSDPELRRTNNGTAVTSFTLAVDRDYKAEGEAETDFIEVVAFKHSAEFVCKHFTKGRMAIVNGRLQIRNWTDRDGNKRKTAEIIADRIYFGDSKKEAAQTPADLERIINGAFHRNEQMGKFSEVEDDGTLPF